MSKQNQAVPDVTIVEVAPVELSMEEQLANRVIELEAAIAAKPNVLQFFTADEMATLEDVYASTHKSATTQALRNLYPGASLVELLIIEKMKQIAENAKASELWKLNAQKWKNRAASSALLLGDSNPDVRARAITQIRTLAETVPEAYHSNIFAYVVKDVNKGDEDERVVLFNQILTGRA